MVAALERDFIRWAAFDKTPHEPGYIKAYPPGVRENGGQYTHAALWLAMACFRRDRRAEGAALLRCACASQRDTEIYGAEPFVIPADIYAGDKQGRAGWSWYTGSAGLLYRAAVEGILGITRHGGKLHIAPSLPEAWDGFSVQVTIDGTARDVSVKRTAGSSDIAVTIDGKPVKSTDRAIPFD